MGQRARCFWLLGHGSALSKSRNYYLNKPAFLIRRKSLNATLEVRQWPRYGRKQVRKFRGNPKRLNDKQDSGARAQDLQNLSRFGLARGRTARCVPGQRR